MESLSEPLLIAQDTGDERDDSLPEPEPYPQYAYETAAEMLVRLRGRSTASLFRPFKRSFFPHLTPAQLLKFLNRPPGPLIKNEPYSIRPAAFSDVPDMVMISARAYFKMPVQKVFEPSAEMFPRAYLTAMWEGGMMWMSKRGALTYAAVRKGRTCVGEEEEIIGFIRFSRQGSGQKKMKRQHGLLGWLVDWVISTWWPIREKLFPHKCKRMRSEAEKQAAREAGDEFGALEKYLMLEEYKERWFVGTINVKEEWRGRGVGRALMNLALEKAREDMLPLTLSATEHGAHLYKKMGFDSLETFRLKGYEENSRWEIMVWDPRTKD